MSGAPEKPPENLRSLGFLDARFRGNDDLCGAFPVMPARAGLQKKGVPDDFSCILPAKGGADAACGGARRAPPSWSSFSASV